LPTKCVRRDRVTLVRPVHPENASSPIVVTEEEMREYDEDCLVHEPEPVEEAVADC
jgi:hypothetical protein